MFLLSAYEFPFDMTRSLEIALFHTYGSRSVSRLLDRTAQFSRHGQKRYDDTNLLIASFMEAGWDGAPGAQAIAQGARTAGMTADAVTTVDDIDAAHDVLVEQIEPGDVVLFKSSRDSGLRMLGDRLVEESGTPAFPVTEVTS